MKKTLILFLFLFLAMVSCDDDSILLPKTGQAKCIINDSLYIFDCYFSINNNKLNMFLDNFNAGGFLRKRIRFAGDCGFNLFGKEDSTKKMFFVTRLSDGDVGGNFYSIIGTDGFADFVEIIQCTKDSIAGRLQGSFYRDPPDSFKRDPSFPDTLIIRDGVFKAYVF